MNGAGIGPIGQIGVAVQDLDAAVRFYRVALGLRLLFEAPPSMAFFDCGGIRLMLAVPQEPESDRRGSILYFRVPDIQAAHSTLVGRGVQFVGEPHPVHRTADHELWMAFFRDVEDNHLALMSEVALA